MRLPLTAALICLSGAAEAQGLRDSDTLLTEAQMAETLSGHIVEFYDGSKSRYRADGRYSYTYTDDTEPFLGTYALRDGSTVCVLFDNGFERCDTYVRAGERLVLIIADGTRFPVRTRSPLSP